MSGQREDSTDEPIQGAPPDIPIHRIKDHDGELPDVDPDGDVWRYRLEALTIWACEHLDVPYRWREIADDYVYRKRDDFAAAKLLQMWRKVRARLKKRSSGERIHQR